MHEEFRLFQEIGESVEEVINDQYISLEIKQCSRSLNQSLQPCFEELKESGTRLNILLRKCLKDLDYAEAIWRSKPQLNEVSKVKIWKHLGELSARTVKIRRLGEQCKEKALDRSLNAWLERVNKIRDKWFIDAHSGQIKQIINQVEKQRFIKEIQQEYLLHINIIKININLSLKIIVQELELLKLVGVFNEYIEGINNPQEAFSIKAKVDLVVDEVKTGLKNSELYFAYRLKDENIIRLLKPDLEEMTQPNLSFITWEQFYKLVEEVKTTTNHLIVAVIDARVELAKQALQQAITFYNDFLKRQERYQQETPQQRENEKLWIEQQKQKLLRIQRSIEAIIQN